MKNPFELVTASKLSAREAVDLWCDDKRLDRVNGKENCFVNGHRGTGKSMLFRILQHDCQNILYPETTPDFLAVYFPVRDTEFMTEEFELFQADSQRYIISESHLSLLIVKQLFLTLSRDNSIVTQELRVRFRDLVVSSFSNAFQFCSSTPHFNSELGFTEFLSETLNLVEAERTRIVAYIALRLYDGKPFEGPLFLFDTFLGRISDFFSESLGQCLYFLIDDGDDLPVSHTVVLNSWIARRRGSAVFKVSTMFGYKTFETRYRSAIQHPHDFFQYDIGTRYMTNSAEDYIDLLREICRKRLRANVAAGDVSDFDPDKFFPLDAAQNEALAELAAELLQEYKKIYKGRAARDYVYRHLTSEYLKILRKKHSVGSFVYSGFSTLAVLSSGHVRDFIICAQRMYDRAARHGKVVESIPASIQSSTVREHADEVLSEIKDVRQKRIRHATDQDWRRIAKLIDGLCNLFKAKLFSEDSERRVFSFCFQNEPSDELVRLLELAICEGYFMRGFISRKEGTGRRVLYVLTRRLGPAYNLDVSAYSGYLSLTSERVENLMVSGSDAVEGVLLDSTQMTFFELAGETEGTTGAEQWEFISPEEAGL